MKINKTASFWIRILSRIIDLIIFGVITSIVAYANLSYEGKTHFREPINFYVWAIVALLVMVSLFIVIPLIFNGSSLGMLICRIKIEFKNKKEFKSLLKREALFSMLWIGNLLLMISVINHTLIEKIVTKTNSENLTTLDNFRIGVFTSFGSVTLLFQFIFAISIIVKKEKVGIHDKYSETRTVYKNKFTNKKRKSKGIKSFKPHMVKNNKVEWIGE